MTPRRRLIACTLVLVGLWGSSPGATAHTDTDVVAVPAGKPATITLQPTHGCGESPTVEVSTRVPVVGAMATEVVGWTAESVADGRGNTVLEWTGGSLPADRVGAFPVTFVAPDTVGQLLTFPFVQVGANDEELAWINGDPSSEHPAPRLLILPPTAAPAETLDDVPADAPGRDQLTAVVDVDNPREGPSTTAAVLTTQAAPTTAAKPPEPSDDTAPWLALAGGGALILLVATVAVRRRRT